MSDTSETSSVLPSTGELTEYSTGAVRDASKGKGHFADIPACALRALAKRFEDGAAKYDRLNWAQGIPLSHYYNSLTRHAMAWAEGATDEDHAGAVLWNMACAMWTDGEIQAGRLPKELDDLPFRNPVSATQKSEPWRAAADHKSFLEELDRCFRTQEPVTQNPEQPACANMTEEVLGEAHAHASATKKPAHVRLNQLLKVFSNIAKTGEPLPEGFDDEVLEAVANRWADVTETEPAIESWDIFDMPEPDWEPDDTGYAPVYRGMGGGYEVPLQGTDDYLRFVPAHTTPGWQLERVGADEDRVRIPGKALYVEDGADRKITLTRAERLYPLFNTYLWGGDEFDMDEPCVFVRNDADVVEHVELVDATN